MPGDTNGQADIFIYDRIAHATERLSVASDGTQANSSSTQASISADGRFVAFGSAATNLVPGSNFGGDVFVRDRVAQTTERVAVASDGNQGNANSNEPSISADGRYVAFDSDATNLVPADTNGQRDVFVRDRQAASPITITTSSPLPSGTVGVPYSVTFAATGGTPPYTWAIISGSLPPGLMLNASTGVLSGTPTTAGTFGFTVQVTDSSMIVATKQFNFSPPPPSGTAGSSYSVPVTLPAPPSPGGGGGGGTAQCTSGYSVISGTLPPGLTLDPATGVISGTPINGGTYNFTIGCTVVGGQTATKDFTITIDNPAPALTSIDPNVKTAGDPAFTLMVTGSNFVTSSKVQWNGTDRPTTYVSATQLKADITVADVAAAGTASITVVNAAPGGGTSNALTLTINPANRPPLVTLTGDATANEGDTKSYTFAVSDPDAGDTFTAKSGFPDCGAGGVLVTGSLSTTATGGSFQCRFPDGPAGPVVRMQVADSHAADSNIASVTVSVANVAPSIAAPSISPEPSNEGSSVTASATFTDPGANDGPFTCTVDYGDGSASVAGTVSGFTCTGPAHTYADNGSFTVAVTVKDKDNGSGSRSAAYVVKNVAPSVGSITGPLDPAAVNTAVNVSATFTDAGTRDTHTAVWDWGDGNTTAGAVTETGGSGSASGSHTYTTAGVYTVKLTVTDKDGGVGQSTFQFVVVYDPNGGFVTGGGWITSPTGACKLTAVCAGATGTATFGFVSKYQKGANVPIGQTEFQFQAGGLNFHSELYDWLVVAGAKAQFKGTGTINGGGSYAFMLTAIDGSVSGGGGTDKFRIKIWEKATGTVVYDNQAGAADDAEPTTAIAGGSIVVHK